MSEGIWAGEVSPTSYFMCPHYPEGHVMPTSWNCQLCEAEKTHPLTVSAVNVKDGVITLTTKGDKP